MRLRLSLATWAAIALVAVSAAAIVIRAAYAFLDEWAPDIAIEALAIAFALLVVESIFRRNERLRAAPHVRRALTSIASSLRVYAGIAAHHYAIHHNQTFSPIPVSVRDVLRHWLNGVENEDGVDLGGWPPRLVQKGVELAHDAHAAAELDRDWLPDDLLAAVNALDDCARDAEQDMELARFGIVERITGNERRVWERNFVHSAAQLAAVVERHAPEELNLRASVIDAATRHRSRRESSGTQ
jgi:hypothetical protein